MRTQILSIAIPLIARTLTEASRQLPRRQSEWISISQGTDFQSNDVSHSPALRQAQRRLLGFSDQFLDGSEKAYDESSQAWRLLGVYIDCTSEAQGRRLQDEDEQQQQEGNQEDNEQQNEDQNDQNQGDEENQQDGQEQEEDDNNDGAENEAQQGNGQISQCNRYLLWAAYVDLDYEGGGLAEYQIYDNSAKRWNKSMCQTQSSSRCVKMDCHLPSSNFKLLGFFREQYPGDFFEQLISLQGSCLLDDDEYQFMENSRNIFSNGCQQAANLDENGNVLYYATQPRSGGGMGMGLYEDPYCSTPYHGKTAINDVLSDAGDDDMSLPEFEKRWNSNIAAFKTCQPCKTYSWNSENAYVCQDATGGEGANQCSQFVSQANSKRASYSDVSLASMQGTIVKSNAVSVEPSWGSRWGFFSLSTIVFVVGLIMFCCAVRRTRRVSSSSVPLI